MFQDITKKFFILFLAMSSLAGCAMMGGGIPAEKLGEYALVQSRVDGGSMTAAPIGWINGKTQFPAWRSVDLLPGEYTIKLCVGDGTCGPSREIKLNVEAGKRYTITRDGGFKVMVSDRMLSEDSAPQVPFSSK